MWYLQVQALAQIFHKIGQELSTTSFLCDGVGIKGSPHHKHLLERCATEHAEESYQH